MDPIKNPFSPGAGSPPPELERLATRAGYRTVSLEAHEDKSLAAMLVPPLRTLLFDLDRRAGAGHKAKRALAVLKGFMNGVTLTLGGIEVGLDIEPERGAADSGDLESDLPNLFLAVAEAAQERDTPVALLLDELQYFNPKELSALIMAMHKMQQGQLPVVLLGAGLPILPGLADHPAAGSGGHRPMAFTVPLFDEFMRRAMPLLDVHE